MGRHAAPGPPDRPTPERPEPERPVPERPQPSASSSAALSESISTPPLAPDQRGAQANSSPQTEPALDSPAVSSTVGPIGLLASLVLGAVVGLTAGGVLWWAGQPLAVAGAAAGGALLVVVLAAWVARGVAARHPLQ